MAKHHSRAFRALSLVWVVLGGFLIGGGTRLIIAGFPLEGAIQGALDPRARGLTSIVIGVLAIGFGLVALRSRSWGMVGLEAVALLCLLYTMLPNVCDGGLSEPSLWDVLRQVFLGSPERFACGPASLWVAGGFFILAAVQDLVRKHSLGRLV